MMEQDVPFSGAREIVQMELFKNDIKDSSVSFLQKRLFWVSLIHIQMYPTDLLA